MSLYGTFEGLPLLGSIASSSIVFSVGYTMLMFHRIAIGELLSNFSSTYLAHR
jgi:NADH-ubiquinone oxidoreductase chain 4